MKPYKIIENYLGDKGGRENNIENSFIIVDVSPGDRRDYQEFISNYEYTVTLAKRKLEGVEKSKECTRRIVEDAGCVLVSISKDMTLLILKDLALRVSTELIEVRGIVKILKELCPMLEKIRSV